MAHKLPFHGEISEQSVRTQIKNFLESDSKYATAANVLLAMGAITGILFIGAVAPNLIQIFGSKRRKNKYTESQIGNAIENLNRNGFVKIINRGGKETEILLTNEGKTRIKKYCFYDLKIKNQKKWDKKWRVVIFDIPINRNDARGALRRKIREIGFYKLQDSVWIYPYPCEDEMLFVAHVFGIENCINVLTVERVLHEEKLRKIFKLNE